MASRKVKVGKIDLDTCGAAFLLGVTREDEVEVLRGNATEADLANPEVICIEVGGSGRVSENNWDHHEAGGPEKSATFQIWEYLERSVKYQELIEYIDLLDTKGPQSLPGYGKIVEGIEYPSYLSTLFAGMLLTERNPVEQLHKGIEILRAVAESGQDPYGMIKGFDSYAKAKAENTRQIAKALERARYETTQGGLKMGYLETQFFGAPGALYGNGAQVVVALNPDMNGVRKFTIAGNGIRVDAVAPKLNQLEAGWGGPATGTILGSPREGSQLSLEEVVKIVKETL